MLASVLGVAAQPAIAATAPSAAACLAGSNVTKLSGTYGSQYKVSSPGNDRTFDARNATFVSYPGATLYPFTIGSGSPGQRVCVIGGKVVGQQSRSLTWQQMKTSHDGDGLRFAGNDWYLADGLRVDNVEDGFAPRGTSGKYPMDGDGFVLRNAYMKYIRDDCVENDDVAGGLIIDSLFDGCNTGISERPTAGTPAWNHPAPAGETLTIDHVLMRLQAMPGPRGTNDPKVLGHGQLFKWSSVANKVVIRDSIFLVERKPNGGSADFPSGTVASNTTVVWLGGGSYPGKVPSGVKVTTDRSIWDRAVARWLQRHGCTSFDSCSKLHDPDPYDGTPTPTPTTSPTPTPTTSPTPTPTTSPTPTASPSPTPAPPAPGVVTLSFGVAADATILKAYPKSNYGQSVTLGVDGSPVADTLMKLKVSGIGTKKVVRAYLTLRCLDGGPVGGSVARVPDNSWKPSGVTWSNAPAGEAKPFTTIGAVKAGTTITVDLTTLVTGDGIYSIRFSMTDSDGVSFASSESATAAYRPKLAVEIA